MLAAALSSLVWAAAPDRLAVTRAGPPPQAVLVRTVAAGTILSADDFGPRAPDDPAATRDAVSRDQAVGMQAARLLRARTTVRRIDLRAPHAIRRGEAVTIVVRAGGLSITMPGRALDGGAAGDPVRVVGDTGRKTLRGIVDAPGRVRLIHQGATS